MSETAAADSLPGKPPGMTPQPDPPMRYGKAEMSVAGQMFVATVAILGSLSAVILLLWQLLVGGAD